MRKVVIAAEKKSIGHTGFCNDSKCRGNCQNKLKEVVKALTAGGYTDNTKSKSFHGQYAGFRIKGRDARQITIVDDVVYTEVNKRLGECPLESFNPNSII